MISLEGTRATIRSAGFATPEDYGLCRAINRRHGTTYFFATRGFPGHIRRRTHAVYAFVRTPDDWVDLAGSRSEAGRRLREYRSELLRGVEGICPKSPVLRAFCDVVGECSIGIKEPLLFLDAMERDLTVDRYRTYADLRVYMRGSACAVGLMMLAVMEADTSERVVSCAKAMGEAMQMTNFLRDVGEDAARGRIYLPLEDLASFGVTEEEVFSGRKTDRFVDLMRFEIERTRTLYALAEGGIEALPPNARFPVGLASALYARILKRIESADYDVFNHRARTSLVEKLVVGAKVMVGG